jgi:hypothetical protein
LLLENIFDVSWECLILSYYNFNEVFYRSELISFLAYLSDFSFNFLEVCYFILIR